MASSRRWVVAGLAGQAAVLCATVGMRRPARASRVIAAIAAGVMDVAAAAGLRRAAVRGPGPADAVTLARGTLACAICGLAAGAALRRGRCAAGRSAVAGVTMRDVLVPAVVPLAAVALALDAVDGRVARRTDTASAFGARLDGETDAFLILVLSLHVARARGAWVAVGGLARYAFGAAGRIWPWLRRPLPFRYWRKVATAGEGIALAAGAASFVPAGVARPALLAGLGLIVESFGRDILWLRRHRRDPS